MPEQNITPVISGNSSTLGGDGYDTGHPVSDWWNRVSDGWKNFWSDIGDRLHSYYDQSQVGNQSSAALGEGIASGDTSFEGSLADVADVVQNGSSAQVAQNVDISSLLGSSAKSSDKYIQAYYDLYKKTGNVAYLEKLIDYAANLDATSSARDWDKMMSDTSFSRLMADIKKSGLNPWLALQNGFGQASSGSVGAANVPGSSASSQAVSERNNLRNNSAEIAGNVIRALLFVALFALKK